MPDPSEPAPLAAAVSLAQPAPAAHAIKDGLVPVAEAALLLGGVVTARTITTWYTPDPACAVKRIGRDFFVLGSWIRRQLTCDPDWAPPASARPQVVAA